MNWLHRRRERRAECAPQASASEQQLAAAIAGAWIVERHAAGEDGELEPRVFVTCPTLRGTFIFSPEAAERRVRRVFPDLPDAAVAASVRHLVDRVSSYLTEKTIPAMQARLSFVRDWAADGELFRL